MGGQLNDNEFFFGYMKIEGDREKIIDTIYNIVMLDVNRKLCNALPCKFDELMNSTKKYYRYQNILNNHMKHTKPRLNMFISLL